MLRCNKLPQTGDHNQRFEVSYFDPHDKKRHVYGWCNNPAHADLMRDCINKHPTWRQGKILDREKDND